MSKKDSCSDKSGNCFARGSFSLIKALGKGIGKSCGLVESMTKGVRSTPSKIAGINLSSKKVTGLFTGGLRKKFGVNKSEVKTRISYLKGQINELYLEMGKLGAQNIDPEKSVFDSKEVQELTLQIENYEKEVNSLNKYLNEIEELEKQNIRLSDINLQDKDQEHLEGSDRKIQSAIESCIKKSKFPLKSDALIFQKILYDLLDKDVDIRRLAVGQLGKLGHKQCAAVLKEVLKIKNEQLQAEVINALILLEDHELFNLCKIFIKHDYTPLRSACVRGLYKVGKQESIPYLVATLQDENAEIRNSSAMFLGWLDAKVAIPSLLQAALDFDKRVRLSAISSLANIRDETSVLPLARLLNTDDKEIRKKVTSAISKIIGDDFKFKSDANEEERSQEITDFKDWYLKKKHGMRTAALSETLELAPASAVLETAATATTAETAETAEVAGITETTPAQDEDTISDTADTSSDNKPKKRSNKKA
ncbi:MAG: HEAT repeat domain-containing protein [Oligoflexia bacterium]|nr:HEAT repeat domain-containing protein [Oligoflexia bacterium]